MSSKEKSVYTALIVGGVIVYGAGYHWLYLPVVLAGLCSFAAGLIIPFIYRFRSVNKEG